MLTEPNFMHSKIIVVLGNEGQKVSVKNDNLIVTDKDNNIKLQATCYKIFCVFIVGSVSITSGIVDRAKKFGFSIVMCSAYFRVQQILANGAEGNTVLRKKQYNTQVPLCIAKNVVLNKISNQILMLEKLREPKSEGLEIIKKHKKTLEELCFNTVPDTRIALSSIMGIEGICAKVYFNRIFGGLGWNGRQPRVKRDKINLLLDIGYTALFNFIEVLLNLYGFDVYKGNLHQEFWQRKSLVCDMIEPFRPIIDYATRKALNLKQLDGEDFFVDGSGRYSLNFKSNAKVVLLYIQAISDNKQAMFRYIQNYYRWFCKNSDTVHISMPQGEVN